jgi:uncharacterized protein (TIGR03437 family)
MADIVSQATTPIRGALLRRARRVALSFIFLATALHAADRAEILARYGQLPLSFEALQDGRSFVARGAGSTVRVGADRAAFGKVTMRLLGASPKAAVAGLDPQSGTSNYIIGNDSRNWRTAIVNYGQVRFGDVYPGVDVVYHGRGGKLEYDFHLAPYADSRSLLMRFDGADRVTINSDGDLIAGPLRVDKPIAYQDGRPIEVRFTRRGAAIGFQLGRYDHTRPLVIDPTLVFSTFLGGSFPDGALAVAVDAAGNIYVAGSAESPDFPLVNPLQPTCVKNSYGFCYTGFITKFNAAGTALIYSTYLSGSYSTTIYAMTVDAAGNVYAAGTAGSNFPLVNPIQSKPASGFVTKLNAAGTALVYSTFLGGSVLDGVNGIAVDSAGNVYVAGYTWSPDFPVVNAYQSKLAGPENAFITKLNAAGSALVYSTYLGGSGMDSANGIAVDSAGSVYVTGNTTSKNFPLMNAFQTPVAHAFVSKFNASGALAYSTYLGGSVNEQSNSIAVDGAGNMYIGGGTASPDFPIAGVLQTKLGGSFDGFVTKLNAAGSALVYSTFLGGSGEDEVQAIAVDAAGNVTGDTQSSDFPVANALQSSYTEPAGGQSTGFVAKIAADGSHFIYSTYLGSTLGGDGGSGVAIDATGAVYVVGGGGADFPILNALYPTPSPLGHAFVAKITDGNPATCVFSNSIASYASPGAGSSATVRVTANSNVCAWQASSAASWVTITQGSFSGIATVFFTVAPNTTLAARSTTLTVAGQSVAVSQSVASHVAASATAAGAPSGVGRVPLTLVSDVAYPLTTFYVTLVVAPVGAAPALTSALGFQADPSIAPPRIDTSGGIGTVKLTWTLMHPAPMGTFKLGELLVPIPATATLGQSYTAQSTGGSSVYTIPDTPAQAGGTYTDTFIAGAPATVAVSDPVPLAVWISPNGAAPGSAATIAVVYGEGFTSASTVLWNGSPRATTLLSESQLQFTATSADLAAAGTAQVSVSTASPGGGQSNALPFMIASTKPPVITNGGVVSAARYTTPLAGGMLGSLFGVALAPGTFVASVTPLPISLGGTMVLVDGTPAPLIYVSPTQINFQLPWRLLNQTRSQIAVVSNGITSNAQPVSLAATAPAIFSVNQQGTGQGAILVNGTSIFAAPLNSIPGVQSQPVTGNQSIEIYCTGLGAVDRDYADGVPAVIPPQPGIPPSINPPPDLANSAMPTVTVGGVPVSIVYFSGLAPGYVGLYQLTVLPGSGTPLGNAIPVVVTMNGVSSNVVTIAVQAQP